MENILYPKRVIVPWTPPSWKKCTQSEYFTISKGVFNFNVLALAVSQILGGYKCTLGGLASPRRPLSGIIFCVQSRYFTIFNGIFKFNFLALLDSEKIGGPKFKLRGPPPLQCPPAETFLYPNEYFTASNSVFNFNFLALVVSEVIGGHKFTLGALRLLEAPSGKILVSKAGTLPYLIAFLILTF